MPLIYFIKEHEQAYLDCNKTVTMLRRKKLGFHSSLYDLVYCIYEKHHDEFYGYNMMKYKLEEQDLERQKKRMVTDEHAA